MKKRKDTFFFVVFLGNILFLGFGLHVAIREAFDINIPVVVTVGVAFFWVHSLCRFCYRDAEETNKGSRTHA